MQVRALKAGYYDHKRRKEGDEFTLRLIKGLGFDGKPKVFTPEMQFSVLWMESLEDSEEEVQVTKARPVKAKAKQPSQIAPDDSDVI